MAGVQVKPINWISEKEHSDYIFIFILNLTDSHFNMMIKQISPKKICMYLHRQMHLTWSLRDIVHVRFSTHLNFRENKVKRILCFKNSTWLRRDWGFFGGFFVWGGGGCKWCTTVLFTTRVSLIFSIRVLVWNNNILYLSFAICSKSRKFRLHYESFAFICESSAFIRV